MMDALATRPARAADAPDLVALVNSAYRGESSKAGWTTEADLLGGQRVDAEGIAETIATPDNIILIHVQDDRLVACVHLQRTGEDCYLGMLTVRPTTQGSGLGGHMIELAERWATEHWLSREMHMTVLVQRPDLIAWYERRGYRRTGEIKPFPYGDERFGLPRRPDLAFEVLCKALIPEGR
jgi:ribosomal protein S18 acetylase RimI-like enzyme